MAEELRELVSRQLRLPANFVRVDDATEKRRNVTLLTTVDWLIAVQSRSSSSGHEDENERRFRELSDADRTRYLAPSTETLPSPWIRVRVLVEPKSHDNAFRKDASSSTESWVLPPKRRIDALHDANGRCVQPKFLHFAAFLSNYAYENAWKTFDNSPGNGSMREKAQNMTSLSLKGITRRDAILSTLDALYESPSSSLADDTSRPSTKIFDDEEYTEGTDFSPSYLLQLTAGHSNVTPCICVLDSPTAVFVLQPYAPHSLFHAMTYAQTALTDNYAKSLFVGYQLLKAMDFFHARGVFVGDLRLVDVQVDEKLWIKVFPRNISDSFVEISPPEVDVNDGVKENKKLEESSSSSRPSPSPLKRLTDDWVHGLVSNFDYLMALNRLAGRVPGDPNNHPIFPWVVDFSAPDAYRDLTKSKYRLNKGDHQLDLMFEQQQPQIPVSHVDIGGANGTGGSSLDFPRTPHHISDMLSDITYYVYCARRVDKATLCAHVRSHWVPHEYPSSMRRMYFWTPDECIPEFFTDPAIFSSVHEDLPDLAIPDWSTSPRDFVDRHRRILEGQYVSKHLHRWIDLTFGFMLTGPAAVANKNVCLQLVDGHDNFSAHGVVQLFTHPHPPKLAVDSSTTKRPSYLDSISSGEVDDGLEDSSFSSKLSSMTLTSGGVVEAHSNTGISADANFDELTSSSSSDKKSKSPKEDTLKRQQHRWSSKKIVLPDGYNPVAKLEAVESLHLFVTKNLHEIEKDEKSRNGSISKYPPGKEESSGEYVARMTKNDSLVFAVLVAEMFLAKRLRFQIGDLDRSLTERTEVVKSVCRERFHDIPRPFRRVLKMVLGIGQEKDDFLGLPLSPDLLLHPMVDLLPFPATFPALYAFLGELTTLSEKMRHHRRHQTLPWPSTSAEAGANAGRRAIQSLSRHKIDLCCKTLPQLLPKLSPECLDIVLPHLTELLEDQETAVAAAWHLFGIVASSYGPEKTIKHFLASMIKLFQQDDKTTTAKHMKLYHRTFILQLMVGFGLNAFLNSFSTLMVEATAGFKNFIEEEGKNNAIEEEEELPIDNGAGSLELTRSSEDCGVTFDISVEDDADSSQHSLERSGGVESTSIDSIGEIFDGVRTGPLLEADLASLEGEMSSQVDESEDEEGERDRDSLTVVENDPRVDSDDENVGDDDDKGVQLGTSVHSLSRLAHYKADKRGDQKMSDASSLASDDLLRGKDDEDEGDAEPEVDGSSAEATSRPRPSSLRSETTTGGRSSGLSSDQCNIADVSSETIKWLASRLGPVLTTKYLSGNLLKMLSLCYLGVEQLQPTPESDEDSRNSSGVNIAVANNTLNYAVKGDANARHVLDAISTIAIYYGEQIILLHYFPYLAEIIASSAKKRRLHVRAEAGLVSAMVLLRHCLPLLGDQTLMDYLPDVVFKDILEKLVTLISNVRIAFPSGALARSVICYKIIDVMVMVSLRIGFEMTRKMMTTLLKRFFACFDVVHSSSSEESGAESAGSSSLTSPRTPSIEASMYVELKKDSITQELTAGAPFELKLQTPSLPGSKEPTAELPSTTSYTTKHVRSSSLYSLSALATMEPRDGEEEEEGGTPTLEKGKDSSSSPASSGADMDSPSEDEERNRAELKQVFTSALAHSVYVPFCKLAGNIHLDQTLSNKDLIHSLVAKVEVLLQSSTESGASDDGAPSDGRGNATGSLSHSTVSSNFGKDVAVSGNRINISGADSGLVSTAPSSSSSPGMAPSTLSSSSQILSPSRIPLSPDLEARALIDLSAVDLNQLKSLEMQNNARHLKGNWLQYWEHEQGLSPQDANSFEFKGIRLQSFVGHTGAVRSLRVLDNENSFLSASKDKTVKLWSIKNFGDGLGRTHPRWTYTHHKKSVFSVLFVNSLRLVASCDSTVHLWDPFVGAVVHHYDAAKISPVSVLASIPSPSATLVAATTENHNSIKLLDCRQPNVNNLNSELRLTPSSGAGLIRCVAVSPDGHWVACGFSSGMLCVVDLRTGMIIGMWKAHEGEIYKVETFNSSTIVTASFDQSIQVWDVIGKKRVSHLRGHLEPAHCLGFFKSAVISATTANRIGVHSNVTPEATFTVSKLHTDVFKGVLTTMSVLSLNRLLLFGADNGSIKLCC